jgi:hypothetical protein
MDTRAFYELVLPKRDSYVLLIIDGKRKFNIRCETLDDLAAETAKQDKTTRTVYFAVGAFANNLETTPEGRTKVCRRFEHATRFKSLCADVDVGPDKPFADQPSALRALGAACRALSMPLPTVVMSGRGIHIYWPLTSELSADLWERMSIALRAALLANGLHVDTSKIHDRTMVLRPPGTHHKKDPSSWVPVTVAKLQPEIDPQVLALVLAPYKGTVSTPAASKPRSALSKAMMGELPPVVLDDLKKCQQIRALLASGGALNVLGNAVEEPLWRLSLGVAKFCEDPLQAMERLASQHPEYDQDSNIAKMEGWHASGPPSCAKFEEAVPGGCTGCPYAGKVSHPSSLSRGDETVTAVVSPTVPADPNLGLVAAAPAPMQSIPIKGYSFKKNWLVYTPPIPDAEEVPVCPYNMFVVSAVANVTEDRQSVRIAVLFPLEGWEIIEIPTQAVAKGGAELVAALSLRRVYISGDVTRLRHYLMTYLAELQKHKSIEYYYSHFGWQPDGTFLGPDGVIGATDGRVPHFDGAITQYAKFVVSKGNLASWSRATKLFSEPTLTHHGLMLLMMAGSVLFESAGPASALVNAYSRDSGSGKTLVGLFGCSLWGHPTELVRTVNDTDNALYKHFGILRNTGAFVDEITTMDDERLRAFVFTLPEGREKARVKQSADGFRESVAWRMPIFASSNRDLHEALGNRYSSEAEKLRVLQLPFDRVKLFEDKPALGYTMFRHLREHYGVAGPALVREILVRGGPKAVYDAAYERFATKYGHTFLGQERFYAALFVAADAIGELGEALGVFQFSHEAAVRTGLPLVAAMRVQNSAESMTGLDLVSQFCTEHAASFVNMRVRHDHTGAPRASAEAPQHRGAVGRTEIERDKAGRFTAGALFLNSPVLRRWCRTNGSDYRSLITDLRKAGVRYTENRRKNLYSNVEGFGAVGSVYCLQIDLGSHTSLIDAISSLDQRAVDAQSRLSTVTSSSP